MHKTASSGVGSMVGFYKEVINEFKPKGGSGETQRNCDEGVDCSH
jgi:hypothetical protein